MKIFPAILSQDVNIVARQVELVKDQPQVQTVQIDVIDGYYADNLTVTPVDLVNLDFGQLQADFHLMVDEPLDYLYEIRDHQKELPVRAVIGQIEKMTYQDQFVQEAKKQGFKAGLSLDLYTPVVSVEPAALAELDVIQLMAIKAGFQGQKFSPAVFDKLKELQQLKKERGYHFEIIVDGGVKFSQFAQLKKLGVDGAAIGSLLWLSEDLATTLAKLAKLKP